MKLKFVTQQDKIKFTYVLNVSQQDKIKFVSHKIKFKFVT